MELNHVIFNWHWFYSEVFNWLLIFVHRGLRFCNGIDWSAIKMWYGAAYYSLPPLHGFYIALIQEQHGLITNVSTAPISQKITLSLRLFLSRFTGISLVALLIIRQSTMQIFGCSSHPSMYAVEICLSEYQREFENESIISIFSYDS